MMITDLELAYKTLSAKKTLYDNLWDYYDGCQPLVYSRERLREIFKDLNANFIENWCAVIIDSAMERIQLRQFTIADDEATETVLNQLSEHNEFTLEADSVHLAALVTGEAFIVAWKDENEEYPTAYYNDPRLCHVFYSSDNPHLKRMACKWWHADDGYVYLNLYYADHIEYYQTRRTIQVLSEVASEKSFVPTETGKATNTYGVIPVFHFRRDRRKVSSELANVIAPQDGINKLINDMMIAAEFGAFPQRWAITEANIKGLKNAPNEIWKMPPAADGEQATQLGEFGTATLDNYLTAIDKFATYIAISTRTPKHYFFAQGGDPSGEALIAMEAPLNKKCQKYIDRFASTWRQLAQFMLQLQGTSVELMAIVATFDKPETMQPYTEALTRKTNVESGLPLATVLRDDGWTEAEIATMQEDKQAEGDAQQAQLASALVNAQRNFDQGGNTGNSAQTNGAMT